MNTQWKKGLLLLALLAAACGKAGGAGSSSGSDAAPPTAAEVPGRATLRLLGASNPGLGSAMFDVDDVAVWVDGQPVALDVSASGGFDLAVGGHAWNLASFALPPAGSTVRVVLKLGPSGVWSRGAETGVIDTCGPAIEFTAASEWLALRGHAVIQVDLGRSLHGAGSELTFLPQLQVLF